MIMKTIIRPETEMKNSGIEWIGNIPQNWDAVQIRRVLLKDKNGIKIGPFGSALTNKTTGNDEYYVYSQANLVSGDFSNTKNKVSQDVFNSLSNYEVVTGDVCLSMMGTIGKCRIIPHNIKKGIMDSHLIKIRLDNYNSRFFEYVYDKDNGGICFVQMQKEKKGSIMDGLNTSIVKGLYVTVPPLSEQQVIADYLDETCSKIDEIIAEAKASIDEYKELRLSVLTLATTKGLSDVAKYKDSGSRWVDKIPSGWSKMKIHYIIDMPVIDGPHVSPELVGEGVDYISANAIVDGKIDFNKRRGYITREYSNECRKRYSPQKNDILVVKLGASTGKMAMVGDYTDFDIWVPIAVVRCKKEVNAKYVYYSMSSKYFKDEIRDGWTFGTQETLGVKTLESLHIFLPSRVEQDEIVRYLDEQLPRYDSLIAEKESLINDLEAYKKSLIYEVVTGKRRVV